MKRTRINEILKLIDAQGTITNEEIIQNFGISIETVRRDLSCLEKEGLIERVYGGAVRKKHVYKEPKYVQREQKNIEEKRAIAERATKFLKKGSSVFFDLGTTVYLLAEKLKNVDSITAFTNSLRTAIVLAEHDVNVIISGGNVRNGEFATSGSIARNDMLLYNIDVAFIGAGGVTDGNVSDFIQAEAEFRSQIIKNAKKVVVLADYSKFGVRAMCNVCSIDDIDVLITDEKTPKEALRPFEKKGVDVLIAKL